MQFRACLKGRAYRQRVYASDRLLYPSKRVGLRGEGKFERITWDEALETVAKQLNRVKNTYGPSSILFIPIAGDAGRLHSVGQIQRLLTLAGGFTGTWGLASFGGGMYASQATYGTWYTCNTRDDLLNSRLIILLGWNPATTVGGTNTSFYLAQAKEAGAKIICVDPRHTDTAAILAHQWIPIRPGTDSAMLIAMAYVIITENLQNQAFLDNHTIGFESFKNYVLGKDTGVAKTPAWASDITGVSYTVIESLAHEYASLKPSALLAGIAPGRTAYGEQYHRAASTLSAMT
jgi:anaerobic dimethyl sulfoxide reductase subunit A